MIRVELNITELCNLRCDFCPRAHGYPNVNEHMSLETMHKIVEHIESYPDEVQVLVCGRGEPTLHEKFDELMQPLFESKAHTTLTCNGHRVKKYIDTVKQFDYVMINFYEGKQEDFEYLSQFNIRDHRQGHIQEHTLNNRAGSMPEEVIPVVDLDDPRRLYCDKPFDWLYIDWQGNYNLCCNDWDPIVVLGNVHQMSLLEHNYRNHRLQDYRTYLKTGNRCLTPCTECDYRIKTSVEEFREKTK